MAKTPGFTEYVDDRDSSIVAQLRDNDPRTKTEWFEVSRVDSNGVIETDRTISGKWGLAVWIN